MLVLVENKCVQKTKMHVPMIRQCLDAMLTHLFSHHRSEQPQTFIPLLEALACTHLHSVPIALDAGCLPPGWSCSLQANTCFPTQAGPSCWQTSSTCLLQAKAPFPIASMSRPARINFSWMFF